MGDDSAATFTDARPMLKLGAASRHWERSVESTHKNGDDSAATFTDARPMLKLGAASRHWERSVESTRKNGR